MKSVRLEELQRNAYRVLGLTAAATQAEIDGAARRLRVLGGDANEADGWMGTMRREGADIEAGVTRLGDPKERLRERVWWFCGAVPQTWQEASGLVERARADGGQVPALWHDAMLVRLWRVMAAGEKAGMGMWREALQEGCAVARSLRYREWVTAAEQFGDFEKRATEEEMAAAQEGMGEEIAGAVAMIGETALEGNDLGAVERALETLEGVTGHGGGATEWLLARMDEALAGRCQESAMKISAAWDRRDGVAMRTACQEVMVSYPTEIERLMGLLLRRWTDADRRERIGGSAAGLLEYVAKACEAALDKWGALRALAKALEAAEGTASAARIRERLDRLDKELNRRDEIAFGTNVGLVTRKSRGGEWFTDGTIVGLGRGDEKRGAAAGGRETTGRTRRSEGGGGNWRERHAHGRVSEREENRAVLKMMAGMLAAVIVLAMLGWITGGAKTKEQPAYSPPPVRSIPPDFDAIMDEIRRNNRAAPTTAPAVPWGVAPPDRTVSLDEKLRRIATQPGP